VPSVAPEIVRWVLAEFSSGRAVDDVTADLAARVDKSTAYDVGELLLEMAADALDLAAPTRAHPIEYEGLRERYLPERTFRGRTEHHKSHYALQAAIAIRAGIRPDLAGEVSWWRNNDLWLWAWFAVVIAVRTAAERTGRSVGDVVRSISVEDAS
jgi:hypothetical protein